MNKYNILNLEVDNLSYTQIIDYIYNSSSQVIISSVNPEITLQCDKNAKLREIINHSTLKIADGIGIVWAINKIYKNRVERITGIDLMEEILSSKLGNKNIFLYGSVEGVAEQAMKNLNKKYNCNIVGALSGYVQDNEKVIETINQSGAEIVFVGLGCPRQEFWIENNKKSLPNVMLFMGVGGSFDVLSGNIKRAPKWMQNFHLEWLYRVILEPKRIIRQLSLFRFVFRILFSKS